MIDVDKPEVKTLISLMIMSNNSDYNHHDHLTVIISGNHLNSRKYDRIDDNRKRQNSKTFSGQQRDLQHCEEHGQPGNESGKRIGECYFFGFPTSYVRIVAVDQFG